MKNSKILIALLFASMFANGLLTAIIEDRNALIEVQKKQLNKSKVYLPEEWQEISRTTPIVGYIDNDSILHIEFDNSVKFVWEGLENEIPKDGDQLINLSTNENTIYLNPIDK